MEEKLIEYAPFILIAITFFSNYKIFVTPDALEKKLKDYVLKETHDLAVKEIKEDIADIKHKIDRIYDKIMSV